MASGSGFGEGGPSSVRGDREWKEGGEENVLWEGEGIEELFEEVAV